MSMSGSSTVPEEVGYSGDCTAFVNVTRFQRTKDIRDEHNDIPPNELEAGRHWQARRRRSLRRGGGSVRVRPGGLSPRTDSAMFLA